MGQTKQTWVSCRSSSLSWEQPRRLTPPVEQTTTTLRSSRTLSPAALFVMPEFCPMLPSMIRSCLLFVLTFEYTGFSVQDAKKLFIENHLIFSEIMLKHYNFRRSFIKFIDVFLMDFTYVYSMGKKCETANKDILCWDFYFYYLY